MSLSNSRSSQPLCRGNGAALTCSLSGCKPPKKVIPPPPENCGSVQHHLSLIIGVILALLLACCGLTPGPTGIISLSCMEQGDIAHPGAHQIEFLASSDTFAFLRYGRSKAQLEHNVFRQPEQCILTEHCSHRSSITAEQLSHVMFSTNCRWLCRRCAGSALPSSRVPSGSPKAASSPYSQLRPSRFRFRFLTSFGTAIPGPSTGPIQFLLRQRRSYTTQTSLGSGGIRWLMYPFLLSHLGPGVVHHAVSVQMLSLWQIFTSSWVGSLSLSFRTRLCGRYGRLR
jgi:hypothetical protein